MKICILCTSYPRSKDDYWVPFMHSWAKELAKTQDVTVVTSGGDGCLDFETRDNVKIYRFNYFYPRRIQRLTYTGGMRESFRRDFIARIQAPFFMLAFFFKAFGVARKCDVINAHWILSGIVAIPLKIFCNKPIVLTEHGGSIRGLPRWLNRLVLERMDFVTSAHIDLIEEMKKIGVQAEDVKNFLDEEKFLKKHDRQSIRQYLKIKENEHVVSFIARFEQMKDPLTFINSIPYAAKEEKNIKFIVLGSGHLKDAVKKRIKEQDISASVIMPEPTSNVDRFLAISDVFVASSPVENCFSTTILEAMLSNVPCIITKAGMTEKYFTHKKYAYLVEKQNPKMLGDSIAYLLKNEGLRKKLSQNGMEFLDKHGFRKKNIIKKIMRIFELAVKKTKSFDNS